MQQLAKGLTAVMVAAGVAAVPLLADGAPGEGAASKGHPNRLYVVRMSDAPVVGYTGGIPGLQATKPQRGQKIDPLDPKVARYVSHLDSRHAAAATAVGAARVYDYRYSFNGFSAELTTAQAAQLAQRPDVLSVEKDELRHADTASTPTFLGLDAPGGLWSQLGGTGNAGDGVIVGIIDTGIWPESLSFTDRTGVNGNGTKDGKLAFQQIPGWHGRCVPGERFTAADCNQKLIGAQYFNAGFGGNAGVAASMPWEFNSPRDFGGHGTHTASTAAGNFAVPTTGAAAVFGTVNGIAPHAHVAMYKALWEVAPGQGSGTTSDLVAAIDQAVADGVDVINYSISGTLSNLRDPVEVAFLSAADAGIFVAASAGNSGPTSGTVAHPSPWITTVAAGTHNRDGVGSVTLGNGVTYAGASVATAVGPAPFIDAAAAGLPGADPTAVRLCFADVDAGAPVLDPAKVAGKIVLCDRGVNARVNKSLAVQQAGGVGMVLANTSVTSLNADFHFVPTVHVQSTDRAALKAYAATERATAAIPQATIVFNTPAPFTASFSSRGPLGRGDLLKPDVIAPGQDILAAVAPPGNAGRDFDLYSGTSMSSPHVAGLAALLKQRHPDWSPMAIKSALMTTASDVLDGPNTNPLVIFRQGAGHVQPARASDPGLVYDAGLNDWLGTLCGTQLDPAFCTSRGIPVLDPSDYNAASIAMGDLAGIQTVRRTVRNVGGGKESYAVSVTGLAGVTAEVTPASFSINPGATQTFTVKFTRTTAALNAYVGGQLTWTGSQGHTVRSPIVVKPVALSAPPQLAQTGAAATSYDVAFGYAGAFSATARGLVPAALTAGTVADDPTDGSCSLTSPNAQLVPVAIPSGTTYARFSLFDADVTPGADIDLCVFNAAGALVGASGSGTSAETVDLLAPGAGTYTVVVQGWNVAGASPFKLHTWLLDAVAAGNMTVTAPGTAILGATGTISLSFSGLQAATKYLGSVAYGGAAGMPNPTIVRVDVP
jgi:subtilisin family serine protease